MGADVLCVCVPLQGLGEVGVEQGKGLFPCPNLQSREQNASLSLQLWSNPSEEGRTGLT